MIGSEARTRGFAGSKGLRGVKLCSRGFAGSRGFARSSFVLGFFDRSDRRPTLIRVTSAEAATRAVFRLKNPCHREAAGDLGAYLTVNRARLSGNRRFSAPS
jgi:hypothetical protein